MRIELVYGGQTFTVVGRTLEDVQAEIDAIVVSGLPGWISAYDGHGSRVPVRLLVTPGVPITLAQLPPSEAIDGED